VYSAVGLVGFGAVICVSLWIISFMGLLWSEMGGVLGLRGYEPQKQGGVNRIVYMHFLNFTIVKLTIVKSEKTYTGSKFTY
jgi:hypothetical protein